MKILVVSRLKSNNKISTITLNQMSSIEKLGHDLTYFSIKKGGFSGYFQSILKLKKLLRKEKFDIIHAHYSFSGAIASLSGCKNLVVSLMGSDTKKGVFTWIILNYFLKLIWQNVIVKSEEMKRKIIDINPKINCSIIPNGVNFEKFLFIDKLEARKKLGLNDNSKIILFPSNPDRPEKGFNLAKEAVQRIESSFENLELIHLNGISNDLMYLYYNAADAVLLTSMREGSPNVIKEAMACCRPIIATNVGDVKHVIENVENCKVTTFNPQSIADELLNVLYSNVIKTNGRKKIDWLEESIIAKKIIDFYK